MKNFIFTSFLFCLLLSYSFAQEQDFIFKKLDLSSYSNETLGHNQVDVTGTVQYVFSNKNTTPVAVSKQLERIIELERDETKLVHLMYTDYLIIKILPKNVINSVNFSPLSKSEEFIIVDEQVFKSYLK